jgi:hypothetical protein
MDNDLAWVTALTISAPKLTNSTMATNANAPKTLIASELNCQGTNADRSIASQRNRARALSWPGAFVEFKK